MKTILSNFFRLFLRNKGFLSAITLLPVVLFLVMSVGGHSIAGCSRGRYCFLSGQWCH